jgi:predicted CXXCH cytochrome family protein
MKPAAVLALCILLLISAASVMAESKKWVGSEKCKSCHLAQYSQWKESGHAKILRDVSEKFNNMAGNWQGTVKLSAAPSGPPPGMTGLPGASGASAAMGAPPSLGATPAAAEPGGKEYSARLKRLPGNVYQITLLDGKDSSKEVTYTIARTTGGYQDKQRYQIKIGNRYAFAPIQWTTSQAKWAPYHLEDWYNSDGSLREPPVYRSFEAACAGCHATGVSLTKAEPDAEASYTEYSVGCESCHGPGLAHATSPTKSNIVNPAKLEYARAMDICNQCHMAGVSQPGNKLAYAWNEKDNRPYLAGETLSDYYHNGSTEMNSRYGMFLQGSWHHYADSGHAQAKVRCFDCHNPHGGAGKAQLIASLDNNNLCLSCHGKKYSDISKIEEHTRHAFAPARNGLSRCTSCHDATTSPLSGHFLEVIKPQASLDDWKKDPKRVRTNSCNGCHKEWSGDEAALQRGVEAYQTTFEKSK